MSEPIKVMESRAATISDLGVDLPRSIQFGETLPLYAGGNEIGTVTLESRGVMRVEFKKQVTLLVGVDHSTERFTQHAYM